MARYCSHQLLGVSVADVASHAAAELAIRKKFIQLGEGALALFILSSWPVGQDEGANLKSRQAKSTCNIFVLNRLCDQSITFTGQP
jgi:hypothetical protein